MTNHSNGDILYSTKLLWIVGDGMFNKSLRLTKKQLEQDIADMNNTKKLIENQIQTQRAALEDLNKQLSKQQNVVDEYNSIVKNNHMLGIVQLEEIGFEYNPPENTSEEYADEIQNILDQMAELLENNKAIITKHAYSIDGSTAKGNQFQKAYVKNLLIGFNAYCEKKKKAVNYKNLHKTLELVQKEYTRANSKSDLLGMYINQEYCDLYCELIQAELNYKMARQEEKEQIREEKRRLKEQEKLFAEIEKAKLEIQKERRMYEQSLEKALNDAEKRVFEEKLREIDKRENDIDYRLTHKRAGYLYVASTPSLPNMVKCGVTQRLNPLVRVYELSTASLPYPYVCHGFVFDDDVFSLENAVHKYFHEKRVNKENIRKEFFYVLPQEVIDVLTNHFNKQVHFVGSNDNDECEQDM